MSITQNQQALITAYITLLKAYNEHTNIYSKNAYPLLDFHVTDSITLTQMIPKTTQTLIDIGSGSGLPSVIIAILRPDIQVTAVESKSRKTRFLEEAKTALELENYFVSQSDIHEFSHKLITRPDVITAKAFAPWEKANPIAQKISKKGTQLFIPISRNQKNTLENSNASGVQFLNPLDDFIYLHKIY